MVAKTAADIATGTGSGISAFIGAVASVTVTVMLVDLVGATEPDAAISIVNVPLPAIDEADISTPES